MSSSVEGHLLTSTTDAASQGFVAVILIALFVLLTLEKAHRVLVALGAVSVLWLTTYFTPWHLITFEGAVSHMDFNVLLLLAGMMAMVGVLRATGIFEWMVAKLLIRAGGDPAKLVVMLMWFTGIVSSLADNVTTVIFVTPLAIGAARSLNIRASALLLPMVLASNIGGTATLVGDPPNIMIGSGAGLTFTDFLVNLLVPVIVMLMVLHWFALRFFAKDLVPTAFTVTVTGSSPTLTGDPVLLRGLIVISALVLIGFLTHGITGMPAAVPAVLGAGAALILQDIRYLRTHDATQDERTHGILKVLEHEIEWPTLAFFTFLFIIVGAAVETGLVERIATALRDGITAAESTYALSPQSTLLLATLLVLWSAAVLSALIDNIPFVAVSIPIILGLLPSLSGNSEVVWWALSLGACLGGNGTPVGASANVTTLGLAERGGVLITFREFLRSGVPVTLLTLVVATVYLTLYVLRGRGDALMIMALIAATGFIRNLIGRRRTRAAVAVVLMVGVALSLRSPSALHAQTDWRTVRQSQLWLAVTADQPLTARRAFHGDVHLRRTAFGESPQQSLTRGSLTCQLAPEFRFGAGLYRVTSVPYGQLRAARPSRDHPLFPVAQVNHRQGQYALMHRYRFENHSLGDIETDATGDRSLGPSRFARRALSVGAGIPLTPSQRLDVLSLQQWVALPHVRANELEGTLMLILDHIDQPRNAS